MRIEPLETRALLTTLPMGAMADDLGEYMLGSVTVTPVFFESNGQFDPSTEDWTPELITETKEKIATGLQWWVDTLAAQNSVHSLDFQIDWTFADNPFQTIYEPINGTSEQYTRWGGEFLAAQGYSGSTFSFANDIEAFNHQQRLAHQTHWAFTILVANSDADPDDGWAGGNFSRAFAFAQQKFIVLPSGRPASTVAHETGHMFWAFDEYPGGGTFTGVRGYYGTQNLNAWDNPTPGFQQVDSIMATEAGVPGTLLENAFANHTSSPSSLEMVGWRDSDGDGIFDVLDVPLALEGSGRYDSEAGVYRFNGSSAAQALPNLNPRPSAGKSGSLQNDITINQVTHLEFRIDGAANAWQRLPQEYNAYTTELDVAIPVPAEFQTIELRTIDAGIGVTSAIFTGTPHEPSSLATTGIHGFVRHDANADGSLGATENIGLADWTVRLLDPNGQPLVLEHTVEPDDFDDATALNNAHPAVTLTSIGNGLVDPSVISRVRPPASTGDRLFAHFLVGGPISAEWTQDSRRLRMDFAEPVATLSLDAVSNSSTDYGRLEIYNSSDELIGRYTTAALANGEVETMTLNRDESDIAYAIAGAHMGTAVRLDNLRFGPQSTTTTDANGAFSLPHLPAGSYTVEVVAAPSYIVTTAATQAVTLGAPALATNVDFGGRVAAPWQNPANPFDVVPDGTVAANDVLELVFDINFFGARELPLPTAENGPPPFFDVNGDGFISAVDVLEVVNFINNQPATLQSGEGEDLRLGGDQNANQVDRESIATHATVQPAEATALPQPAPATVRVVATDDTAEQDELARSSQPGDDEQVQLEELLDVLALDAAHI